MKGLFSKEAKDNLVKAAEFWPEKYKDNMDFDESDIHICHIEDINVDENHKPEKAHREGDAIIAGKVWYKKSVKILMKILFNKKLSNFVQIL